MKSRPGPSVRVLVSLAALGTAGGCSGKRADHQEQAPAATREASPPPATAPAAAPTAPATRPEGPLGQILPTAPLPFDAMLGAKPPDVESQLGEPLGKGFMRKSCVRFIPNRTWFRCDYAMQTYADKTGTFKRIGVQYEDGIAVAISWEPIPGEGPVDPTKALAAVGLVLPGMPQVQTPEEDVTVWSYFNSAARLRIHGREYRAEVSTVGGAWANTKVELTMNDHLTEDEKSRLFENQPKATVPAAADEPKAD